MSVWSVAGDFRRSSYTDGEGRYSIGGLPGYASDGTTPVMYQAGAAREGFVSQVEDSFAMSSDRTLHFTLEVDPDYDWGPGRNARSPGCACAGAESAAAIAPGGGLILVVWALRKRR